MISKEGASQLAGDLFDLRESKFACGKKYLAVILADVTGHGVAAALSTTIISSYWSMWCTEAVKNCGPSNTKEMEALSPSAWFNRVRKEMKTGEVQLHKRLSDKLRETRRGYRSDRTHEDDITLVVFGLKADAPFEAINPAS